MSQTVCYFKNGIGNLICQMPAIAALAYMDPTGKVDYCLDETWKADVRFIGIMDILTHWDKVNKVLLFPKNTPAKYKRYFYTLHSEASPVFDYFKSKSAPTENRVNWRERVIHETEYYKDLVRKLGWNKPFPQVNFPTTTIGTLETTKPVLGICNGLFNTASWQKKSWPHFEKLCKLVSDKYYIVKIGFGKELDEVKTYDNSFVGKLSITQTANVISQCDKFVTTDSSCMHIAAALGIDTVALFGGTYIFKNAPLTQKTKVLFDKKSTCRPCQDTERFFSCKDYQCMKNITPEEVVSCL